MNAAQPAFFNADNEIGRDLAQVDWAATPLGPPDGWPQSLQTTVSILLSSRFPMWMAWGPQLTFFCNAAYRRDTLGRKYPWALGRPAAEVWAEIWPDIGPRIEHVLSTGSATWDQALLLFLERSGYSEETYHTFSYSPLHDDAGVVVGMLCVVTEDTERAIGERRMATLLELGSDPSVVRNEEQAMTFASSRLGLNPQDLPFTLTYVFDDRGVARLVARSGIDVGHRVAPDVVTADAPGAATSWPTTAARRGEAVVVALDDEPFSDLPTGAWRTPPTQALVVPLLQLGGEPMGFLVAALNPHRHLDEGYRGFVDLVAGYLAAAVAGARSFAGQQRRAEELAELDRAKTAFFSNISHEFRTPLTLILGPVAELRAGDSGLDDRARHELELVHRNGLRLAKLVNTLLDFSRIQAGRMQARFEPVDLGAVTADLASVFRSAVDRAGLVFDVDCPTLDAPVYVDRDMWEKVMLNLLSNALKFTFEGSIAVRVRGGDDATITVSDTGIGIPEAELPRLFERFHRIQTARARSTEGSGIGLALVKELVMLHGGTITADAREGRGSEFTIRLPFGTGHLPSDDVVDDVDVDQARGASTIADPYVAEALRWLPDAAEAPPELVGGQPVTPAAVPVQARLLVADDNADMRDYLCHLLRAAGYHVTAVEDGQRALEQVRAQLPDLVISDVMMPRLDGLQLLEALRTDPRTAAVSVLLLSARAGQEASIEGLQAGADDYLVKPFAAADLLARVRANVELAKLRNHHSRWRTALVDSLQEAFFVCDERGAVIEINTAFTDILGYGPSGLPYEPVHPWWPDAVTTPDAHRKVGEAFARLLGQDHGDFTVPVTHRDGHRIWVNVSFNHVDDPDTGRRVMVGTFRDVTAEHYAVQRQTAIAELNQQLAQSDTPADALYAAIEGLCRVWAARRVLALTFPAERTASGAPLEMVSVGEPAQWADVSERDRRSIDALREADLLSADVAVPGTAGIALQHPRGVLVLWIELSEDRPFTPEDETLLTVLAGRLGQGLHRVTQIDQQRETALALQHAILGPARLPNKFAVRYRPASRPLQVGGDWYDVVDLGDGRIGLVVGDCVGHGLAAATVMGQLRSACRALLIEHPSPGAALAGLDRFAKLLLGAECTTAFCAVLTPETGELVYSSAGHPPPVLVEATGETQILGDGRGLPLGLRPGRTRAEARLTLPARATLLLYTDGLVERRDAPLDAGIARAARMVRDGGSDTLSDAADQLMSGLAPSGGYHDDVALLLYRQPGPLDIEFPANAEHVVTSRAALRAWLGRAGIGPDQTTDVLIAAGEAVANAIEHGHRDLPDGRITLRATALVDRIHVVVADTGNWRPARTVADSARGRGLALMRGLMHDVTVVSDDVGTTVELSARIS